MGYKKDAAELLTDLLDSIEGSVDDMSHECSRIRRALDEAESTEDMQAQIDSLETKLDETEAELEKANERLKEAEEIMVVATHWLNEYRGVVQPATPAAVLEQI